MKIGMITMWYNEEFLAPFFLNHYQYVDKIHFLYDVDSSDRTREIACKYLNVEIEDFKFPNKMNDFIKRDKINELLRSNTFKGFDWVYCVDADEFIWPPYHQDPRLFLEKFHQYNIIHAAMWQVYRHAAEKDLDANVTPIYLQRRHGDPERFNGVNARYNKPCVVRPGHKIKLGVGSHHVKWNFRIQVAPEHFDGTHWAMADPEMAIERRVENRRNRFSTVNRLLGLGCNNFNVTEEEIRRDCEKHLHDPQLF